MPLSFSLLADCVFAAESGFQAAAIAARAALVESVAEVDDEVMALYLDGNEPTAAVLQAALRRVTCVRQGLIPRVVLSPLSSFSPSLPLLTLHSIARRAVPVLVGAAFRNKGVQPLLDAIVQYLPSPLDVPVPVARARDGSLVDVPPTATGPTLALAFKACLSPSVSTSSDNVDLLFRSCLRCR
jgi:elongation factor G